MKLSPTHKKQIASFRNVSLMLAIAPLCLLLAAALISANTQVSNDVSHSDASTTAVSSPADWTQFHRDNMQRWNPYETTLGINNAGTPQVKWKNPLGMYRVILQPALAVANGVAYSGSDDGNLYALNASTGAKLWSFATGGDVDSSPAVVNGVVYFGSRDDNVYAVNASTGAKLWSFATGSAMDSSPAVVNGVVYIGSFDHNVYALNASSGARLWSFTTADAVGSSPAVANGIVYVASDDHNVYALNASTGANLWSFVTGSAVVSSPAVANGIVYVGSQDGNVYALNARTGAKVWSYNTGVEVEATPAVANGVVYIGTDDVNVYALNASTGALLWIYRNSPNFVISGPAVANGVVYFTSSDGGRNGIGSVYALNASTGAKLWGFTTGYLISSPTIVDGVLYVRAGNGSLQGNIYAFSVGADLFLRVKPSAATVHPGDLLTYAFPVWNLGPDNAVHEVLNTQVPAGTTFDNIRISGTPGLGTCTTPPFGGTGQIMCHENSSMAPHSTWTVRLAVKVTAPTGTVITANAATMADTLDPNLANNTATASIKVQ